MSIETSSMGGTGKIMLKKCINKDVIFRREQRSRLVENIVALGDLIDTNNVTEVGKRFFYEIIKVEAMNLKDLDLLEAESISHSSSTENDVSDTRQVSSTRLLNNIRALGELSAMSSTSEAGRALFWEAIKLEIKTFKDLNLIGDSEKVESDESIKRDATIRVKELTNSFSESDSNLASKSVILTSDSGKVESEDSIKCDATARTAKLTNSFSGSDSNASSKSSLLSHSLLFSCFKPKAFSFLKSRAIPDQIDYTTKPIQDSSSNRTLGTLACSSLRSSGNESKVGLKKERQCTRSFQPLPRLCQSHASQREWLRSVQGPIQNSGVMEMVIYLTEEDSSYFFAATE